MKIINAGYEIMFVDLNDSEVVKDFYRRIETVGRVCYKSEADITEESSEKFIKRLINMGHEAMLEHAGLTVKFIVDRGVSHELVRHRLASFAQESTRYCNYSKDKFGNEITVIEPVWFKSMSDEEKEKAYNIFLNWAYGPEENCADVPDMPDEWWRYAAWESACHKTEYSYMEMLNRDATPQEARDILPTSVKTEIVVTANLREWRHILNLRAAGVTGKPHPQMLEVMVPLLNELREKMPAVFGDIMPMEV